MDRERPFMLRVRRGTSSVRIDDGAKGSLPRRCESDPERDEGEDGDLGGHVLIRLFFWQVSILGLQAVPQAMRDNPVCDIAAGRRCWFEASLCITNTRRPTDNRGQLELAVAHM